ncbi:hypothetical protein [Acetobacter estunensis]|uniref:hypothetical protein n=1 Tax=Acetobacter estunensis TaxID=104097 RepID=UPI001C2D87FB|nr:hypothetical protein [Acetobacter estunensis]MBV1837172.1 hypothetical protein [Acetobacter estunensis]
MNPEKRERSPIAKRDHLSLEIIGETLAEVMQKADLTILEFAHTLPLMIEASRLFMERHSIDQDVIEVELERTFLIATRHFSVLNKASFCTQGGNA